MDKAPDPRPARRPGKIAGPGGVHGLEILGLALAQDAGQIDHPVGALDRRGQGFRIGQVGGKRDDLADFAGRFQE